MKKNKNKNGYSLKALLSIFFLALLLGALLGKLIFNTSNNSSIKNDMNDVYTTLINEYIEKIDEKKLNEAAIKGMMSFIKSEYKDDHTVYFNPDKANSFAEIITGQFYGTGLEIYKNGDEPVTVSRVFKNSPAEKAGIRPGDQYIKVNGEDVTKKSSEEISKLIKGKIKKTYKLVIRRDGKDLDFTITTDIVDIPSVESKVLEKDKTKIGYIYVGIFAANTDDQFLEEFNKLKKENIDKFIIDLRYDTGGDLDTVINIASNFMNTKQVVVKIVDKNKTINKYSIKDSSNKNDMVVLVNGMSASGSEVLASALQENCGATLVGERTFGKGSVQRGKSLSNGAMIKYTIQTWETSKGKQINNKGIKPDVKIKFDKKYFETYKEKDDNQLQKALEILTSK